MAFPLSLLIFTILCQTINFALVAGEPYYDIRNVQCFTGFDIKPWYSSNFKDNVHTLVSTLVSESSAKSPPVKYFQTSVSEVPPTVHGSYLCRGDLSAKICHDCLKNVQSYLKIEAKLVLGHDCVVPDSNLKCIVYYANSSKSLEYAVDATFTDNGNFGDENITKDSVYKKTLSNSIQGLIKEARYGNWTTTNFATKVVEVPQSEQIIYILVQCTPDMPPMNCSNCLSYLRHSYSIGESESGRTVGVNCLLMYDNQSFFGSAYRSFRPGSLPVIFVLLLFMYSILL